MKEAIYLPGIHVPFEDQETHINYSRFDKSCTIWTSDTTTITKLDRLCKSSPDYYKLASTGRYNGKVVNKEYLITDKTLVSFRSGKVKREMTEEQKEAARQRMKDLHLKGAL